MITLPSFNQWDPRWGSKPLGISNTNMAESGCYVTALTMDFHNFAISLDPGQVVEKLNATGAFDSQGFLNHSKVMVAFPEVSFVERGVTTNMPGSLLKTNIEIALTKIKNLVRIGNPVLLHVDNIGNDGLPDHAVLLYDAPDDDSKWKILDPAGGGDVYFSVRYGDIRKKIYGWIAYVGRPIAFPDYSDARDKRLGQAAWRMCEAKRGINVGQNIKEALDAFLGA